MMERRGLLRGLFTLPLIGGRVTLIGNPTAAAVPVSAVLMRRYVAWLANEHAAALWETNPLHYRNQERDGLPTDWHVQRTHTPLFWFPDAPDIEAHVTAAPASSRAAVTLSAAGVQLTGGADG